MAAVPGDQVVSAGMRTELLRLATRTSSEPRGRILFERGEDARGLYLVCSGKVSMYLEAGDLALPARIVGPGAVVGLPATVAGSTYSLTAEVIEQAELAFVPREIMLACLAADPDLCFEVMRLLSGEIAGARAAIKKVGTVRPPQA